MSICSEYALSNYRCYCRVLLYLSPVPSAANLSIAPAKLIGSFWIIFHLRDKEAIFKVPDIVYKEVSMCRM